MNNIIIGHAEHNAPNVQLPNSLKKGSPQGHYIPSSAATKEIIGPYRYFMFGRRFGIAKPVNGFCRDRSP
jgi:hypothetical protein